MTIFEDVGEKVRVYALQNLTALSEVMIVSINGQVLYKSEGVINSTAAAIAGLITRSGNVIAVNDYAVSHESEYVIFRVSLSIFVVIFTSRVTACTRLKQKITEMCEDLEDAYREMQSSLAPRKTISLDASKIKKPQLAKPPIRARKPPTRVTLKSTPPKPVTTQQKTTTTKNILLNPSWIQMIREELKDAKESMNEIVTLATRIQRSLEILLEK